jgi:hypothetical protein
MCTFVIYLEFWLIEKWLMSYWLAGKMFILVKKYVDIFYITLVYPLLSLSLLDRIMQGQDTTL